MPATYIVTYNPNPFQYDGQEAKQDARARDERVIEILRQINFRTNTIQEVIRIETGRFRVTIEGNQNYKPAPIHIIDIVRALQGRGFQVFDDERLLL